MILKAKFEDGALLWLPHIAKPQNLMHFKHFQHHTANKVIAISLLNTLLSQYNVFFFMFFNENLFIIENTTMQ